MLGNPFEPRGGQLDPAMFLSSTFFVSREMVRTPQALHVARAAEMLGHNVKGAKGAIALRFGKAFLCTTDGPLSAMTNRDICEVTEYDPVRKVVMVIGTVHPTRYSPMVWTLLKTEPASNAIAVLHPVPSPIAPKEQGEVLETRLLPSSFEEAMEAAKVMKGRDHIFISDKAVVLRARDIEALVKMVTGLATRGAEKPAADIAGKRNGKGEDGA
jgi:hypothetical protein